MATNPNQKPVPSEDYVNMRFNAGKLDEFITSTDETYTDRLGQVHMTAEGIRVSADDLRSDLASSDAGKGAELISTSLDEVTVQDFISNTVTMPKPSADNMASLIQFGNMAGEGGQVKIQSGTYRFSTPGIIPSCNYVGVGQGGVVFEIDASVPHTTFFDFAQPLLRGTERGFKNITFKTINGNGNYLIGTVGASGFNGLLTKNTFEHLFFMSNPYSPSVSGFPQQYSWKFLFHLGDSWMLTMSHIDAAGCYRIEADPTTQFLDGFVRFNPAQGILSCRMTNIMTHNIANAVEIVKKTYFCLDNVDIAQAYRGVYDASDRSFETNAYAYGESVWNNVIINAQLNPIKLANRFDLVCTGLIVHRASSGFNHGLDWVGIDLSKPRVTTLVGVEVGTASGYTGQKIGLRVDGGDVFNLDGASFGSLDKCIQVGITSSANGATHGFQSSNISIFSDCTQIFDLQSSRSFRCAGFAKSSAYNFTTFVSYGDSTTQLNSEFIGCPTIGRISYSTQLQFYGSTAGTDLKMWLVDTSAGFVLQTRTDANGVGNNAYLITRSGTSITQQEWRATRFLYNQNVSMVTGTGSPEGIITASIGSTYHRTDGGSGTTLYVKESGTGNIGWVSK